MKNPIKSVGLVEIEYPLANPYQLSFVLIKEFRVIRVEIVLEDGRSEMAEVVPLEGYSEESYEFVLKSIKSQVHLLIGLDLDQARDLVSTNLVKHPFSATAILTSIDLFDLDLISKEEALKLETLIPFSSDQLISGEIQRPFFADGKTYKLKLLGDLEADLKAINILNSFSQLSCLIRADANQAYNVKDAESMLHRVSQLNISGIIEYFEQLLPTDQWLNQKHLVQRFPQQCFMLDEPIIDFDTIDRAIEVGVQYVKLKLYKQGGIREVLNHAKYAHQNGLKVIFGNGVASWSSNQVELSIYSSERHLFSGVHEANGYLKIKE